MANKTSSSSFFPSTKIQAGRAACATQEVYTKRPQGAWREPNTTSPGRPVSAHKAAVAHHPRVSWQRHPPADSARRALLCVRKPRTLSRALSVGTADSTHREPTNSEEFKRPREPLRSHLPGRSTAPSTPSTPSTPPRSVGGTTQEARGLSGTVV